MCFMKKKTNKYHNSFAPSPRSGNGSNFRLILIALFVLICFGLVGYRLFFIQVIKHDEYEEKALKNIENRHILQARRGTIFDRNGRPLAKDVLQYSVGVVKSRVRNKSKLIDALSRLTGQSHTYFQRKLQSGLNFVYLEHKMQPEDADVLRKLNEPGLVLEKRFLRTYPYSKNAAQVIGFCDLDNQALGGIEYQYNQFLQGKPGWKIYQRDALGNQLPNLDFPGQDPIDGFDIYLSLDMEYQTIVEDGLRNAVEDAKASEGVAILMDPNSGEILALSNYPQFDANEASKYNTVDRKNRAVTDIVEPGSTFKIAMLSTALERIHLNIDKDIYFCENGSYRLFGSKVVDHQAYGWLTPRKIIENSSNIGTMKIAADVKPELFYKYIRNLGFGMITGIDLPGESQGILHPLNKASKLSHFFMSIGYEIGVTPIQLINAYAVVANGGKLYAPHLMRQILGPNNTVLKQKRPTIIRQVLSGETSSVIREILCGVVEKGTGKAANIEGIKVAGKTGTAQLYDPKTKSYNSKKHLASFVGFFPAEHPQYVLLVMIRQPQGDFYGGLVAAPAFKNIARHIISLASLENLELAQLSSSQNQNGGDILPHVENLNVELACKILDESDMDYKISGSGPIVTRQEALIKDEKITGLMLYLGKSAEENISIMPSLTGLSMKEAISSLSNLKINPLIEGNGVVVNQIPKPGAKINKDISIKLICKPS